LCKGSSGDTDTCCGHGVRVGVECGAIGKVSFHRGQVMGPADLQRYHSLLLKKQHELSSALSEAYSRVPAAGSLQGDMIDQANADADAALQIRLHRTDGRLARAIEEALARIKRGTYGVCEVCRQPISEARLEAVPWTHLCRGCKELSAT
jgi:DnaK suppressor protein